nr:reverse transcriptase domain-containing protein [Tanacetum cinerariifolium]
MTLELANHAICTPDGIARDVFVPIGKFTFPADFVVVDYERDPRVPVILGRPFLRTTRALIDVHGEEMILRDGGERLTLNMKHETASYSNHHHRDSVNLINIFNISIEDCLEDMFSNKQSGNPTFLLHKEITSSNVTHEIHDSKGCTFLSEELPDIDSFNDIHPYFDDDPLSGNTTYSADSLLEEFTNELALITYPPDYDDNLTCDIVSDLREIEFLLYQGEDSAFKDSIDQTDLANRNDLFVDPTPEMFTDEQPPDYSFPPRFDVYPDDFLEIESDADNFNDDLFDSKREKIKEAELLIDQLDLPCDILSEYDSFNSQDFSRDDDLPSPDNEDKDFSKDDDLPSPDNEDKDFDPPFYELLVFKEVPNSMKLLPFSSENEEKVFKPGIYTSKKVKENQEKDKIRSKPNKNGRRGEAGKSQKQLQGVKDASQIPSMLLSNMHSRVLTKREVSGTLSSPSKITMVTPITSWKSHQNLRGLVSNFMASQDARITRFEADFKQNQSEITNKLDTLLKAFNDRMTGALSSDTVKNPNLNPNSTSFARSYPTGDPQSSSNSFKSVNAIQTCFKSTTNIQKDQLQVNTLTVNEIETPKPKEPKEFLKDEFVNLHLNLPVFEVLAHVPFYDALLDKYILSLKLGKNGSEFIQSIELEKIKDPRLFILPCRLGDSKPFDTLANLGSCARLAKRDFGDNHLPKEWEIAKDVEVNPFKDILTFRKMVEFLGSKPINLKRNMWESKEVMDNKMDWDRPPKEGYGAWHIRIELIDPDREKFDMAFQSISTTRKLSPKENPSDILNLDYFHHS